MKTLNGTKNPKLLWASLVATLLLATACADPKSLQNATSTALDTGIIGGQPVAASDEVAKSTVGLEAPGYGVFCTGVLVAKNLVVTAGHCSGVTARPSGTYIVFGNDLHQKTVKIRVLGGKTTDAWPTLTQDKDKNWGDIALLRMEKNAPAGYVPARLLGTASQLKNGADVVLAGYGLTNMDPETDPEKIMKVTVKLTDAKFSETEIKFDQYEGKGACHGDSGGPAFTQINGKTFLIGVTSRAASMEGAGTCMTGAIYTSIPGQIDFLKSAAKFLNSKDFVPDQPIPQPEGM